MHEAAEAPKPNILDTIVAQRCGPPVIHRGTLRTERESSDRKKDVEQAKQQRTLEELKQHLDDYPLVDFADHLRREQGTRPAHLQVIHRTDDPIL